MRNSIMQVFYLSLAVFLFSFPSSALKFWKSKKDKPAKEKVVLVEAHEGPAMFYIPLKIIGFGRSAFADRGYEIHPASGTCYYRTRGSASQKEISCARILNNEAVQSQLREKGYWEELRDMFDDFQVTAGEFSIQPIEIVYIPLKIKSTRRGNFATRGYEIHPVIGECFYRTTGDIEQKRVSCKNLLENPNIAEKLKDQALYDRLQFLKEAERVNESETKKLPF